MQSHSAILSPDLQWLRPRFSKKTDYFNCTTMLASIMQWAKLWPEIELLSMELLLQSHSAGVLTHQLSQSAMLWAKIQSRTWSCHPYNHVGKHNVMVRNRRRMGDELHRTKHVRSILLLSMIASRDRRSEVAGYHHLFLFARTQDTNQAYSRLFFLHNHTCKHNVMVTNRHRLAHGVLRAKLRPANELRSMKVYRGKRSARALLRECSWSALRRAKIQSNILQFRNRVLNIHGHKKLFLQYCGYGKPP